MTVNKIDMLSKHRKPRSRSPETQPSSSSVQSNQSTDTLGAQEQRRDREREAHHSQCIHNQKTIECRSQSICVQQN